MRNLKRALSLALAAIMLVGMMVVSASAASYNNLTDKDEIVNKDAVSMLVSLGIIEGKPDGSYAPTENVDRAQMAKMLSVIMNKGVVAQIGSPQEIYYHPNSEFVADFIGEANFLKGKCVALEDGCGVLQLADTQVRVAATENMTLGEDYTIVLRPESAGLVPEGNLKCRVVLSCFMGAYQNYHVMVGDTLVKLTDYNPKNHRIYQVGETCALTFEPDGVHVL